MRATHRPRRAHHRRRPLVASLAATLALVAGCTSGHAAARLRGGGPAAPAGARSAPEGATGARPGAPAVPGSPSTSQAAPPRAPTLRWKACEGRAGWECASLTVPVDREHPGPTLDIALDRHRAANPAGRLGSLLVNPGGPGASGVDFAFAATGTLLEGRVVDDFDIVGFDPRGVGASSPVRCVDGPALDRINHLDPNPTTPAKLAALIAGAKELSAGCAARSGAELAHLSTVDAAKDLEDIRIALGDAKLTYIGFSYGTLLGATYASLFPTRVRALALDAAIDPAVDQKTMVTAQAIGFEKDLNDFLADCTSQGSACAFRPSAAPDTPPGPAGGRAATLRAAFDAVMARITAAPLPGAGPRTVGPGEAFIGVLAPLYDRQTWPVLAQALGAAQRGDGGPLLAQYDAYAGRMADGTYNNEEVANAAVNCLDHVAEPVPQLAALAAAIAHQAPYFGAPIVWGDLNCNYWPVPPVTHTGPLHAPGAPPILVVGSTGDPVTPYAGAQGLAAELGSGVLVTRHGDGHAGYPASACVRAIVDAYLVTLAVPSKSAADCAS